MWGFWGFSKGFTADVGNKTTTVVQKLSGTITTSASTQKLSGKIRTC